MRRILMAMALLIPAVASAEPAETLFGTDGYRVSHYRGPVPDAPAGVRRIAAEALAHKRKQALLIDVMPAPGATRSAHGAWHLASPHSTIPGAHWFPEAGRGDLTPDIAAWLEHGAARLTHGRKRAMIVTFCVSDCWMSWNAARRLRALGYTNVWWLADGTDGWHDAGLPLVDVQPEPGLP